MMVMMIMNTDYIHRVKDSRDAKKRKKKKMERKRRRMMMTMIARGSERLMLHVLWRQEMPGERILDEKSLEEEPGRAFLCQPLVK